MTGISLPRILRNIGFAFGAGAGFLTAALVLAAAAPGLLLLSLLFAVGGAFILAGSVTAVLTLLVELAEGISTRPAR
ncbi:MAG: hypothetical protein V3U52_09025 [Thermoplasmata archaeon]